MTWLISLIILLLPSYLVRFSIAGLPFTLLEVIIYLSVLWLVVRKPMLEIAEKLKPFIKQTGWPIALLFAGGIIGVAISPDRREALGLFRAFLVDPLLVTILVVSCIEKKQRLQTALLSLVGSGLWVGFSALLGSQTADHRALGIYSLDLTASPNFLALYLAPLVPLSLIMLSPGLVKSRNLRVMAAIAFLLELVGIILSGSRGGLLAAGFGIGLVVFYWLARQGAKTNRPLIKVLFGLFILLGLAGGLLMTRPDLGPHPSARVATSNNLRYEIWHTTVNQIIPNKPFTGVGLGNYQNYFKTLTQGWPNFPEYIAPWAVTPHNIFLTFWVNLGLLGLLGLVWLCVLVGRWLRQPLTRLNPLDAGLIISFISLLVHGLVDAAYWKNDLAILFWLFVSLAYVSYQLRITKKDIAHG